MTQSGRPKFPVWLPYVPLYLNFRGSPDDFPPFNKTALLSMASPRVVGYLQFRVRIDARH